LLKKGKSGEVDGYELSLSSAGAAFMRINQASASNAQRVDAATPYPYDGETWVHIAARYDGTYLEIFVDGVKDGSVALPGLLINANDLPLSIGAEYQGAGALTGTLDGVRI
jgi:hypothetical protein